MSTAAARSIRRTLAHTSSLISRSCPCHVCSSAQAHSHSHFSSPAHLAAAINSGGRVRNTVVNHHAGMQGARRGYATPVELDSGLKGGLGAPVPAHENKSSDYAFEVAASNIRFGEGVTREVGKDFANWNATNVGVFTDKTVAALPPLKTAIESLEASGVKYEIFDRCKVEPTDASWSDAISFSRSRNFSHFLAVGGGSVMDTCKVANLFSCYPEADLLEFVNAPIGKGTPISKSLKPLIAVPTTAGTGSETTGTAIYDHTPLSAKTGISSRAIRPTLGIVDTLNTLSCPRAVHISSGLDVLFHSLESLTAINFAERVVPEGAWGEPLKRPAYQGSNPVSDVFSMWALKTTVENLPRIALDPSDRHATNQMLLAASFAGIGFGNAGVHLPHGFSYAISGLNKKFIQYKHPGYQVENPIVPHGISVALTGPSVFEFTAPSSPERHREAAKIFNTFQPDPIDVDKLPIEEVGKVLKDRIARFLVGLDVPRGISALGYKYSHIPDLVKGTVPQRRVLDLAPGFSLADKESEENLAKILEGALVF